MSDFVLYINIVDSVTAFGSAMNFHAMFCSDRGRLLRECCNLTYMLQICFLAHLRYHLNHEGSVDIDLDAASHLIILFDCWLVAICYIYH